MREDPRLAEAVEAAKKACAVIATLAEAALERGDCGKGYSQVNNVWESLRSRAREAPSLLATWGPAGLIIFYASKAADLDHKILNELMRYAACSDCCLRGLKDRLRGDNKKIDATATGYATYLASVVSYLTKRHGLEAHARRGAVKLLDALIEKTMKGEVRAAELLYGVETVSRLIQIYGEPVASEAEELSEQGCRALRAFAERLPRPGGCR